MVARTLLETLRVVVDDGADTAAVFDIIMRLSEDLGKLRDFFLMYLHCFLIKVVAKFHAKIENTFILPTD